MAEPIGIQQLKDASLDVKSLEEVVNGDENTDVNTRLGEMYPSVAKTMRLMTEMGIGFTPFETKSEMTSSAKPDGTYAVVTNDTVTNLGIYLKKSGAWALVPWNNFASLDSLKINIGKNYPLKSMVRDGVTSEYITSDLNFIVDCSVLNASADYYYGIKYYRNGLSGDGKSPNGWIITKHPKATYSTASSEVQIINTSDDNMPELTRTGVQTLFLVSPRSQEVVRITINTAALQDYGLPYSWAGDSRPFWSWIIDENCYFYRDLVTVSDISTLKINDTVTINKDKKYPLKSMVRDGLTSSSLSDVLALILDASVINAEEGYYYSILYYRNGLTGSGKSPNGWIVQKAKKDGYETAAVAVNIINTEDEQQAVSRNGGIQTIFLKSPISTEVIKITLDAAQLQAEGLPYSFASSSRPFWSWIIDENCYIEKTETSNEVVSSGSLSVALLNGKLSFSYGVDTTYRITIEPNGNNSLPNISKLEKSTGGTWTTVNEGVTDWLPPLRATVSANGDVSYSKITTGGNHGKDGSGGGGLTARNIYYSVEIDGKKQSVFDGNANNIRVTIVNEVLAMNTVATDRYAVRECFVLDINQHGVISVNCDRRALEALVISRDRGLQAVLRGVEETSLYLEGDTSQRFATVNDGGSGIKSLSPNAHTGIFHGSNGDQISMSIDRNYGLGDTSKVANSEQLFFTSVSGITRKAYSAIIIGGIDLTLSKGQGYQWRGSYQLKSINDKPDDADSQVDTNNHRYVVYDANDYMIV